MLRKIIFWLVVFVIIVFIWSRFTHKSPLAIIPQPLPVLKNVNGVTNILLLGIGGGTHDGPNLTDTIILASLNPKKDTVTLVSIPRDLWIPELQGKVNTAYQIGIDNNPSNDLEEPTKVISKVTGQPIQYAFRIDFQGFEKAVDLLGGIDVNAPNTLDDYFYPIEGMEDANCGHSTQEIKQFTSTDSAELDNWEFFNCRYKHLHVAKGEQHMDGQEALEYVRSRHADGVEGTDFARSRRQQIVISAIKSKVFSAGTLLNPVKMVQLFNVFKDSIDTNIKESDIPTFVSTFSKMKDAKIRNAVIDYGDLSTGRVGLLENGPISADFGYAYILIPRVGNGNFSEINKYVICEITIGNCTVKPLTTPTPEINTNGQ